MDAKTALKYAEDQGARFLSLRFTDLIGAWHHLSFPIHQLSERSFEEGFGFDASSLRGWAMIHESDMLLVPDPVRTWMDPFSEEPTLCMIANAVDPITKEGYGLDPRSVAQRAESYVKFTGIADTVYFGPEAEFFVFDSVRSTTIKTRRLLRFDRRGAWRAGARRTSSAAPTSATASARRSSCPSADRFAEATAGGDFAGAGEGRHHVECHHHEVATAGQCEIRLPLLDAARHRDKPQLFKYIVRNTAYSYGKAATFMPKPLYGDNGSGMPCHHSCGRARSRCLPATATPASLTPRASTSAVC